MSIQADWMRHIAHAATFARGRSHERQRGIHSRILHARRIGRVAPRCLDVGWRGGPAHLYAACSAALRCLLPYRGLRGCVVRAAFTLLPATHAHLRCAV